MTRILSDRELTVSLLARQLLLERRPMPAVRAVRHLAALQAQYSPSPYVALHSRLEGFRIEEIEAALRERTLVKSTLMRGTLHLVATGDYPAFAAACRPQLSAVLRTANRAAEPIEQEILAGLAEFTAEPRTTDEIRERVHKLSGGKVKKEWLLDYARTMLPMVHVPPSGMWQQHGKFSLVAWDRPLEPEPAATMALVRGYLAAFGPATREDIAAFTWLRYRQIDPALAALEPLRRLTDTAGRDLYDLPGAALPAEDVPAPVRLLARLDAAVISYRDRARILPADYHDEVMKMVKSNVMPYLVDGLVAGQWSYTLKRETAVLTLRPFAARSGPLPADLEPEAERMLAFVAPDAKKRVVELAAPGLSGT
ncbi:MAG: hypothetical protein QOE54_2817 [Streptosporangiaceae bacterium]|jgi:hypothetical protein|nr:hypothetical protein [Streptosporangiaceae bacterium]MDX6430451.1 hypothetical protein [Streptosporangiaceae bacterium]